MPSPVRKPRFLASANSRKLGHLSREGGAHVLGSAAVRQVEKDDIPAPALDQHPDRGPTTLADDEVAFPVSGDGSILDLRWPVADQDHVPEPAGTGLFSPHMGTSLRPSRPKTGRELLAKRSAGLDEQRLV
jgi:hypothetical protein